MITWLRIIQIGLVLCDKNIKMKKYELNSSNVYKIWKWHLKYKIL